MNFLFSTSFVLQKGRRIPAKLEFVFLSAEQMNDQMNEQMNDLLDRKRLDRFLNSFLP